MYDEIHKTIMIVNYFQSDEGNINETSQCPPLLTIIITRKNLREEQGNVQSHTYTEKTYKCAFILCFILHKQ